MGTAFRRNELRNKAPDCVCLLSPSASRSVSPGHLNQKRKRLRRRRRRRKQTNKGTKKKLNEKKKIRKKEKLFSPSLVIQTACSNETSDLAYRCPFYLSLSLYLSLSDISSQFLFVVVVCCCYLREKKTDQNPPKKN